ncbi:hypothetical protein K3G39_02145 [Pontibacter sp. HSC-14F20]|uniref:hypothetical protein n=1 Tax=Pontibacter sp. HSC-14F20 TaxID=2864136 RepID=UPI001C73D13B|nr:hypothetical protein [Pontibacter sp. HSC-14F20]MBX0332032.1 hypothetical protein [Pontibacter sp. HSC-14F20]
MARSSAKLVTAIRQTANRLAQGANYQWGHMGSCNCGHLAQTITQLDKWHIHGAAMWRPGDWSEQLRDYCPQSGLPMDEIIDQMMYWGLSKADLTHLEKLSDANVLEALPPNRRYLKHNQCDDVVLYLNTWANLLELELVEQPLLQGIGIGAATGIKV